MIALDEKILYISQAKVIAIIKQNESLITGFVQKKIVLTTRRCLLFESLVNKIQDIQYQIVSRKVVPPTGKQKNQPPPKKSRLSINQYPQYWFSAADRNAKVVIDQEPTIQNYFRKIGIKNLVKNTTGMVLLKNIKKQKFQVLQFPNLKDSFRFSKGLTCAKAWIIYQNYCQKNKLQVNFLWVRILQEIVVHEDSLVLIDPDLFVSGSNAQITAFFHLISNIYFSHSFQLRYSIVNQESINYTVDFMKNLQEKFHAISLAQTSLRSQYFYRICTTLHLKMKSLIKLNLSKNQLNDNCFTTLQILTKQSKKLTYINISQNQITLANFSYFLQFMKTTCVILNLDLSYNKITDRAVEHIQKFILFALNPPIQQIDFSFNQFSPKSAWRIYVGFLKNFKNHIYMNLVIYPIPFKKEIFNQNQVDFPRKQKQINFNMHSALIAQFQQQSMMKHTMQDIILKPETITIRFIRNLMAGVRLPKNKQQVSKTLDLSNKIENFVYSNSSVEKIYAMAQQMKKFPFQIPPKTRSNFIKFLNKKLNEALLIRDHYSVKYILMSMKQLSIPFQGYSERLKKVENRDNIICKRLQNIISFKFDQNKINDQIDQMTKQSLRLYLQGKGVEFLYYLKFCRDQYIQKLLQQKYNPQSQIYSKMAAKNLSLQQKVSPQDLFIPYEIKIEKRINENFYLHPWQTNYIALTQLNTKIFVDCLQFLQQSQKRQTFLKYFQRIQQRVEFIKNQFTLFTYKQFKISYTDLKINACRLLFLYKNIQDTHFYLQIPIYIKKRPISCQRKIILNNPEFFAKKYHIVNYPNINYFAKKKFFYNFSDIITRYHSQTFENQAKKTLNILNSMFKLMQELIHSRKDKEIVITKILPFLRQIIDVVRHSIYPQQLKQQVYLHLIGWRKGRFGKNKQVIELIPWLTMYLKPPLPIEKYLVAAILQSRNNDMDNFPLCLVSDMNKNTPQNILRIDSQFVQRDWLHNDFIFTQLIINSGKMYLQIHLLDKKKIGAMIPQSMNISQLMSYLIGFHELSCEDRQNFWLYKLDKEQHQIYPLTGSDYVGQVVSALQVEFQVLVCKRRIYSREIKYVYSRYGQTLIDSLYSELKFDYMMRGLFDSTKNIYDITSLLFIIDKIQNYQILLKNNQLPKNKKIDQYILQQVNRIQAILTSYIPRNIISRTMKNKQNLLSQIKAKVSQRMLKKQHNDVYEMKTNFIHFFKHFPQFCSTSYKMHDKNLSDLKILINCMYVYIESPTEKQIIKIQKIISVIPKSKYLLVSYHKNQNIIGQIPLFSQQINIIAVAMDILSYCLMRLKMVSANLYQINRYERLLEELDEIQKSLKKVYSKAMQQKLFQNRQQKTTAENSIMKMSLTLMDLTELIYYKDNKYIKSYLDRKLYANKSQKKMIFNGQMDEEQIKQTEKWNRSIFKTIFPLYEDKNYQIPGSLDNYNYYDDKYGQNSEYQNQNYTSNKNKFTPNPYSSTKLTQKKQDPYNFNTKPQQKEPVPTTEKKNYNQPPLQYTPTRPADPIQDPAQEDVVINKRTTGRSAPPRRRQK